MPNWAYTQYRISGDKKEVKNLHDILTGLKGKKLPTVSNDFGDMWLGNLVHNLGGDWNNVYCRGQITDFDINPDGTLRVETETAWDEMGEVRKLITDKYPSLSVYFVTEEPGNCIFKTNDTDGKYFPEKYYLDICDEEGDASGTDYYKTLDEIVEHLKKTVPEAKNAEIQTEMKYIRHFLSSVEEKRPKSFSFSFRKITYEED